MALTAAEWKSRITTDLALLGKPGSTAQTDIVVRALRRYIRYMDKPIISANLSVNTTTDEGPYDVPATIAKLVDIRDDSTTPVSKSYSYDETKNQITFEEDPDENATWTVYGTPKNVRTNVDTILAAIEEDTEDVLWQFIVAYTFSWANSSDWKDRLQEAEKYALDERRSRNRRLDLQFVTMKHLDTQGSNIADSDNFEDHVADISDDLEMDL